MKKKSAILLLAAILAGFLFSLSGCGQSIPAKEELSRLVADAILADNSDVYRSGECSAEGHKILGSQFSGKRLKVYALTMFGNYGFRNDMFVKVSGSGIIPAVLTFDPNGADFTLADIEYPKDGAYYTKSIKRMFPLQYRIQALKHSEKDADELSVQERKYAEAYLKSIGRDAEIGSFRDLNTVLLTDKGISVEVSNRMGEDKRLGQYPFWIGTSETVENGIRYVRSLSLDENAGQITYRTVEKESGTVTESFAFDSVSGEEITSQSVD